MTIYLLYLPVNTTRGLRSWNSHSESLAPSKSIMSSLIVIHGVMFWGFFFSALLVSNLIAPTWSVALMKTSYHTVIWMNLKIHEGCLACWTKLSNNLCAWISWVAFFKNNNKDPRLHLFCLMANTLVWMKIFILIFSVTFLLNMVRWNLSLWTKKYMCFIKYMGLKT